MISVRWPAGKGGKSACAEIGPPVRYTFGMAKFEKGLIIGDRSQSAEGIVYLVITLLGWSSVLLFLRHLHPFIDAWTANGWRYGMCALVLLPILLVKQSRANVPPDIWRRAIAPAIFNSLGQTCFGFSIYYIEPGLAGFLLRVALISSTLGAFVLFADERALLRISAFWMGIGLIVAGSVGTVILGIQPIVGDTAIGIMLGASSGAFFGIYGVSVRYWMRGVPSTYSFAAISTYTALAMIGLMLWQSDSHGLDVLRLSPTNAMLLVVSAFLGIALGHIAYYASIARLGVAISGAVVQLAPFLGAAASVVVFGEILTLGQWGSGAVMLVGGVLLLRAEQRRPRAIEPVQPAFPVELEVVGDPCSLAAESSGVCEEAPDGTVPATGISD